MANPSIADDGRLAEPFLLGFGTVFGGTFATAWSRSAFVEILTGLTGYLQIVYYNSMMVSRGQPIARLPRPAERVHESTSFWWYSLQLGVGVRLSKFSPG